MKSFLTAAALSAIALAQTQDQKNQYRDWHMNVALYGYTWEPYELTIEDGTIITMMHITGKVGEEVPEPRSQGPLLVQHPMGGSPHAWIGSYIASGPEKNALLFDLYEEGFDLWFPYNKGTIYSRQNPNNTVYDKEFWDFTWYDNAMRENKTQIEFISDKYDGAKVSVLGFSQGTTQLFATVAGDYDFFSTRMHKAGMFSPCTISENAAFNIINIITMKIMDLLGAYELGGPTWYMLAPKLARLLGKKAVQGLMLGGWGTWFGPVSTKTLYHYAENNKIRTFQTWSDHFWNPLSWHERTDYLDLSVNKNIPFGLFVAGEEDTCLIPEAEHTQQLLGPMAQFYKVYPGEQHGTMGMKNDDEFRNDVLSFFVSPDPSQSFLQ